MNQTNDRILGLEMWECRQTDKKIWNLNIKIILKEHSGNVGHHEKN